VKEKGEAAAKEGSGAERAKGGPEAKAAAEGKAGAEGRGAAGGRGGVEGAAGSGASQGMRALADPAARAAGLSPEAAEARRILHDALALRAGGGGGEAAAAAALGAALGGLARLLKADARDGAAVIDDCFHPKAAYVLAQHERRSPDGGAGQEGPNEEALALMEAMRSLDFAGLKAVALERAASRVASLREEAARGAEAAQDELPRARTQAALLLASDPVGVARFSREAPETFPRAAARNVMGELLRSGEDAVHDALAATLALLLRPVEAGSAAHKAHAAGFWCAAGAHAARRIADEEAITAGVHASEAPARALAHGAAAAISLARALGPSPGGAADRDEALRTLDGERSAIVSARAGAASGEAALGEGAGDPRRLAGVLRSALAGWFAEADPEGPDDLEAECLDGWKSAGG
jgi:hypothetical protein